MRVLIAICLVAKALAAPPDVLYNNENTATLAPLPPDVMLDDDNTAAPALSSPSDVMHDDENPAVHDDDNTTALVPPHISCQKENTSFIGIMPCCRNCTRPCGRDHFESIIRMFYPVFDYKQKMRILRLIDDGAVESVSELIRHYFEAKQISHESYSFVKNLGLEDECVVEKGKYMWSIPGGWSDLTYFNDENGTIISHGFILSPPALVATMLG